MAFAVAACIGGAKMGQYSGLQQKGHFCKEDFDGDAEIKLDFGTLRLNEELVGTVDVINETNRVKFCKEIFVQLEGIVKVEFETRRTIQKNRECIFYQESPKSPPPEEVELEWEGNPEDKFILSPVRQTLFKDLKLIGSKTCPFRLRIPAQLLPAAFKTSFGSLEYKICVYLRKSCCNFLLRESKSFDFSGFNILTPFIFDEPIKHESGLSISTFSSKQPLTAEMTLERKGFLPGEDVNFILRVMNPKQFLVKNVTITLFQKNIYTANGRKKVTLLELDTFQDEEINNDGELSCEGKLTIPDNSAPTYASSFIYNLLHLIVYKIYIEENALPLKGEVAIVIGTERRLDPEGLKLEPRRERSTSVASLASNVSDLSIRTTTSFPPNYSELSSRAESLKSLETLPPNYEDLHEKESSL